MCIHAYTFLNIYKPIHKYIYKPTHIYIQVYTNMYMCIHKYVNVTCSVRMTRLICLCFGDSTESQDKTRQSSEHFDNDMNESECLRRATAVLDCGNEHP